MHIVHLIAAARPNFMKVAPLYHALAANQSIKTQLVHTGQHYDHNMSDSFFEDLELPAPDIALGVGSGTHAEQTGRVLIAYEQVCLKQRPAMTVVVGDVNSTLACALAAAKLGVPVAHLEAGLRSFDRSMPEEINRLLTDTLADVLWTPSADADANLIKEGIAPQKIERVGNIMIDSLEFMRPKISAVEPLPHLKLQPGNYGIITLHRPSNVDSPESLRAICTALKELGRTMPLLFPVHPRTRARLTDCDIGQSFWGAARIHLVDPLPYKSFMRMVFDCRFIMTDSGGVQEETSYLGIPCFTLRPNTERPITISQGTNRLVHLETMATVIREALEHDVPSGARAIPLWDGKTASRVVASIERFLGAGASAA